MNHISAQFRSMTVEWVQDSYFILYFIKLEEKIIKSGGILNIRVQK